MSNVTLEHALIHICDVFKKYSGKEGDPCTLNKKECLELIQHELPHICGKGVNKETCQRLMSEMNTNKDDCVDFPEYVVFLARVVMEFNTFFAQADKKACK